MKNSNFSGYSIVQYCYCMIESRTISCSISESPLHFISFLTVWHVPQVADIPEQRLTLLSRHSNGDASHNREDDWNQRRYLFCICLKIIFSCIEFGSFDSTIEGDCPENLCTNALCPAFVVKYLAQKADMHEIQARFLCADSNCCLRRCNAEPSYSQAGTGQLMLWLSSSDLAQFGCMQASTYMARVRPEQTKCLFF